MTKNMIHSLKQLPQQFLRWVDTRSDKQDYLFCTLLGLLNALAMPPVYFFPILLISFPLFIRLLDKSLTTSRAFWKTFLFFFAFHVAGLYWISAALFVDIGDNWWVLPFSLSGLPALMALYPAIAVILWHRMAWQGSARLIALIVLLALTEFLRGWAFTGFPWNLWGYAWVAFLPLMQSVALIGIYGLTIATLIFAFLPVFFAQHYHDRFSRVFVGGFVLFIVAMVAWGAGRLHTQLPLRSDNYTVRIVQPNIKQEAKWNPEIRSANERKLWAHTIQKSDVTPNLVVWPETSITLFDTMDVRRMQALLPVFIGPQTILAAGVLEVELDPQTGAQDYFNRLSFYNNEGHRIGAYDKFHLVPFGEFLPFQEYWPVRPVAFKNGSMTRGSGIQTLSLTGIPPVSPLICYEAIFSGAAVAKEKPRAQWLLNITNDAWYGNTTGPYQHLAITRTRAIEEGLPVIRAANTGISAAVDPFGRVLQKLPLNSEGIIDQVLPQPLKPTFFARYGNKIFFMMLGALWVLAWIWQRARVTVIAQVK